jgi:hypothetical protein
MGCTGTQIFVIPGASLNQANAALAEKRWQTPRWSGTGARCGSHPLAIDGMLANLNHPGRGSTRNSIGIN